MDNCLIVRKFYNIKLYQFFQYVIHLILFFTNIGATVFQYYIKIVPTLYQRRDGTVFSTNQFSITKHEKVNYNFDKIELYFESLCLNT